MTAIANQLARRYPKSNAERGAVLMPMQDALVGTIRPTLLLLLGAVGFVLIAACANVANLLLARSAGRRREIGVRTALGADRKRLIRQLLTESVLLSATAGTAGLLLAYWGTQLMVAAVPANLPHTQHVSLDRNVLLFTLALSFLTGIIFGGAPAVHGSNTNLQQSLKEGTRTSGTGRRRTEGAFVAVQLALAVVLLVGAGLMIQSIWRLWRVDPGFSTSHVLTAKMALSPPAAANPTSIRTAFRETLARVRQTPGVRSDALTNVVPLGRDDDEIGVWLGSRAQPPVDQVSQSLLYITTPDYLRAMGIPLLRGRFFTDRDTAESTPVVVIDDVMAKQLFRGKDAVGKEINMQVIGRARIVGVVGHVKHWGLSGDQTASVRDELYFPLTQVPGRFLPEIIAGMNLVVRTRTDPLSIVSAIRSAVAGPTQDQRMYGIRTMQQVIAASLAQRRFTMLLLIAFAFAALVLAAIGIYGVMAYAVSRRTQELGVRVALGATRKDISKVVLREGMTLAAIGLVVGVVSALALTRLLTKLLYGVHPTDPVTLLAVSLLLAAVALLASYIPARRASNVDPLVALRYE